MYIDGIPDVDVSTHSRLKAAGGKPDYQENIKVVSTHSRLKAAGCSQSEPYHRPNGFNTQPPEGGWVRHFFLRTDVKCFNTQPPEGGWFIMAFGTFISNSFNTQPPEGGW